MEKTDFSNPAYLVCCPIRVKKRTDIFPVMDAPLPDSGAQWRGSGNRTS
jgi:hypothetical protein